MPRRFLRKILPHHKEIKRHRYLRFLGSRLSHPSLWHINKYSVSGAVGVGLFCAFLPIPFEMVIAAIMAIALRVNLPISVLGVFISNPFTWVPLYGPAYLLGAWILGEPTIPLESMTIEWLTRNLLVLWVGCLIAGTTISLTCSRQINRVKP